MPLLPTTETHTHTRARIIDIVDTSVAIMSVAVIVLGVVEVVIWA